MIDRTSWNTCIYDGSEERKAQLMNILIATDGTLDSREVADAVERFLTKDDSVTVFTSMNIPTEFLRGLNDSGVQGASQIALEAGQTLGAGDRAAERLAPTLPAKPMPKADSPVLAALASSAHARTKPLVDALRMKGIEANSLWRSTENKTARNILITVKELDIDLLVIGSHGYGQFEGLLGSTGTKLVRHSPTSVLVLRRPTSSG
jgi:nucleotide-binding universal stress UspA family protein